MKWLVVLFLLPTVGALNIDDPEHDVIYAVTGEANATGTMDVTKLQIDVAEEITIYVEKREQPAWFDDQLELAFVHEEAVFAVVGVHDLLNSGAYLITENETHPLEFSATRTSMSIQVPLDLLEMKEGFAYKMKEMQFSSRGGTANLCLVGFPVGACTGPVGDFYDLVPIEEELVLQEGPPIPQTRLLPPGPSSVVVEETKETPGLSALFSIAILYTRKLFDQSRTNSFGL